MAVVEVDAEARRRSREMLVLFRIGQDAGKDVSRIVATRPEGGRGFDRFRRISTRLMVRREVGARRLFARVMLRGRLPLLLLLTGENGRGRLRALARLVVRGIRVCERVGFGESCEMRVCESAKRKRGRKRRVCSPMIPFTVASLRSNGRSV